MKRMKLLSIVVVALMAQTALAQRGNERVEVTKERTTLP